MTSSSGKSWRPFRSLADAFVWGMFLPTGRGLAVLLLGIPVGALGFLLGLGWSLFWSFNALYLAACIVNLAMLPSKRQIRAERVLPDRVELNRPFEAVIRVFFDRDMPLDCEAADDLPQEFVQPPALHASFAKRQVDFTYSTKAAVRGNFQLRYVYLRYSGGLGLWAKQVRLKAEQAIRVYPDLSGVRGILGSMRSSLILDGRRLSKRDRSGPEFHYIREYTPDDDPRMMNWTASARAGKPMANVRQPEKGKIITLLIDCGRLMGMELDGRVKLDRAIEAALTMAAVALRHGDQVSVLAFSGDVKAYVPPGRELSHLQLILAAVYALHSDGTESSYSRALEHLMRVQRKRSMVVLFSDMENYLLEDELAPYLLVLRRSHPVLLLSLEDPVIAGWASAEPSGLQAAYIRTAAQTFRLDRKRFVARMAGAGIPVLDVPADQLALAAVNRYLELRSRDSV